MHPCDRDNQGGCDQICLKDGKMAKCTCREGYELSEDGITCDIIHPCDLRLKGGCDQECNKKGDDLFCSCQDGYKLDKNLKACIKGEGY